MARPQATENQSGEAEEGRNADGTSSKLKQQIAESILVGTRNDSEEAYVQYVAGIIMELVEKHYHCRGCDAHDIDGVQSPSVHYTQNDPNASWNQPK